MSETIKENDLPSAKVGDIILDEHINNLSKAAKELLESVGDENTGLRSEVNNLNEMTGSYPGTFLDNRNNIGVNQDGKIYTKNATSSAAGVVKISEDTDINTPSDGLTVLTRDTILEQFPKLTENKTLPMEYFPDNIISSRMYGGLVEATLDNGKIVFNPSIELDASNTSYYTYQVSVTNGVSITGEYNSDSSKREAIWDKSSLNNDDTITLNDGDWIYNMPSGLGDNKGILKIVRGFNEVSIQTLTRMVLKDNNQTLDISYDLRKLQQNIETNQAAIKNIEEAIRSSGQFFVGTHTAAVSVSRPRRAEENTSTNNCTIKIPLPGDITDLSKVKKIKWWDNKGKGKTYTWINDGSIWSESDQEVTNNLTISGTLKGSYLKYGLVGGSSDTFHEYSTSWNFKNSSWPSFNGGCALGWYEYGIKNAILEKNENGKYVISLTYYAWTDENTFNGNLRYWIEVYC